MWLKLENKQNPVWLPLNPTQIAQQPPHLLDTTNHWISPKDYAYGTVSLCDVLVDGVWPVWHQYSFSKLVPGKKKKWSKMRVNDNKLQFLFQSQ